jgi:hypothetical protein
MGEVMPTGRTAFLAFIYGVLILASLNACVTSTESTQSGGVYIQESLPPLEGTATSIQDAIEISSVTSTAKVIIYREDNSMIERYIRSLAGLLEDNGLLTGLELSDLDKAEELPLPGNVFRVLVPGYVLFQDSEIIYQEEDLVKLIEEVANITNNDWAPHDIRANLDWDRNLAIVEFETDENSYRWEFDQYGDYISDGFFDSLFQYTDQNLNGSFFKHSSMGQEFYLIYLPDPVASEYKQFQDTFAPSSDEIAEFVTSAEKWSERGYTGWYLIREVLREMNLKDINEPTEDGRYVISILREFGKAGNAWAIELEGEIIALGADRYPGQ